MKRLMPVSGSINRIEKCIFRKILPAGPGSRWKFFKFFVENKKNGISIEFFFSKSNCKIIDSCV